MEQLALDGDVEANVMSTMPTSVATAWILERVTSRVAKMQKMSLSKETS